MSFTSPLKNLKFWNVSLRTSSDLIEIRWLLLQNQSLSWCGFDTCKTDGFAGIGLFGTPDINLPIPSETEVLTWAKKHRKLSSSTRIPTPIYYHPGLNYDGNEDSLHGAVEKFPFSRKRPSWNKFVWNSPPFLGEQSEWFGGGDFEIRRKALSSNNDS